MDTSLLVKQLFFFNLIVAGNYIGETLSCNIQKLFRENVYARHTLGLMTMYFFVVFVDNKHAYSPFQTLYITLALYIWFLLISRTDKKYTIIILSLLFLIYVINHSKEYYKDHSDDHNTNISPNQLKFIKITTNILFITAIILTVYASILYLGEKKIEYKKNWSIPRFIFGTQNCKFNDMGRFKKLNEKSYLKKAFSI
tara:strand:+ start:126 stop:719 length:594 start_codon:yes stop_codon:yes gene_type:complete